jgi:hypothetical protein
VTKNDRAQIVAEVTAVLRQERRDRLSRWGIRSFNGGLALISVLCALRTFGVI